MYQWSYLGPFWLLICGLTRLFKQHCRRQKLSQTEKSFLQHTHILFHRLGIYSPGLKRFVCLSLASCRAADSG